ncbi:MAG: GMC family oxidoreductase N-terminal domain-containing protein [Candidatus Limnocylindrales bacterium]
MAEPYGVCASPYNLKDGRRQSTAVAYLDPARDRPNLTIVAETMATRVILDGDRACGVEIVSSDGRRRIIKADQVVLAAGVFHSPQLLMLSGTDRRRACPSTESHRW